MSEKLKSCPLCGGEAQTQPASNAGKACCYNCGLRCATVEAWNRLPRPSESVLEVAMLQEKLDAIRRLCDDD